MYTMQELRVTGDPVLGKFLEPTSWIKFCLLCVFTTVVHLAISVKINVRFKKKLKTRHNLLTASKLKHTDEKCELISA